jgi:hypothetical protein
VTVPLADWLLGTVYREPAVSERAVAPEGRRRLRSGSSA